MERDRGRAVDSGAGDVVGVLAGRVRRPNGLVGGDQVLPELDVTGGHRLAVRPDVVLQRDGHRGAVGRVLRRVGQAETVVEVHLAVLAEPVERPVQKVLKLGSVHHAEVLQGHQRKDVAGSGARGSANVAVVFVTVEPPPQDAATTMATSPRKVSTLRHSFARCAPPVTRACPGRYPGAIDAAVG